MKYRKKPVVIEAIQLTSKNIKEVYEFVHSSRLLLKSDVENGKWDDYEAIVSLLGMDIPTLEDGIDGRAKHVANIGDFIIKGVKGEFYPCKPDIFELTYEQALAEQPTQEPVAWQWLKSGHMRKKIPKTATPEHWRPLYTHPHQWQGLSDDEIIPMYNEPSSDAEMIEFARAIEAKLREKNHE